MSSGNYTLPPLMHRVFRVTQETPPLAALRLGIPESWDSLTRLPIVLTIVATLGLGRPNLRKITRIPPALSLPPSSQNIVVVFFFVVVVLVLALAGLRTSSYGSCVTPIFVPVSALLALPVPHERHEHIQICTGVGDDGGNDPAVLQAPIFRKMDVVCEGRVVDEFRVWRIEVKVAERGEVLDDGEVLSFPRTL